MLLMTDTFKDAAWRNDVSGGAFIVKSGSSYYSSNDLRLPDDAIQCIPAVKSIGPFVQKVNVENFRTNIQSVNLEMIPSPTGKTGGLGVGKHLFTTVAHEVFGQLIRGNTIEIYLYPGPPVMALADCMLIFTGMIKSVTSDDTSVSVTADEIDVQFNDGFRGWEANVPRGVLTNATYPDLLAEHEGETAPIVYGVMAEKSAPTTTTQCHLQTGFAIGQLIKRKPTEWYFMIANHICEGSVTGAWMYLPSLDAWAANFTPLYTERGISGYAFARINLTISEWYAYVPPTFVYHGTTADVIAAKAANVTDGDLSTYFSVIAHSSTEAAFYMEWHQKGDEANDAITNSIGSFLTTSAFLNMMHTPVAGGITNRKLQFWHSGSWHDCTWVSPAGSADGLYYTFGLDYTNWTGTNGTFWHLASGTKGGDGRPTSVRFLIAGSGWTAGVTEVVRVHQAWLKMPRFATARTGIGAEKPSPATASRKAGRRGSISEAAVLTQPSQLLPQAATKPLSWSDRNYIAQYQPTNFIGFEIKGRTFETQGGVTGGWQQRNWRDYISSSTAILYPGDVVESILRNELLVPASLIDTWSFDRVSPQDNIYPLSNVAKCYLNMPAGKNMPAKDLCERIGWEHSIFFYRRRNGQFRAADCFGVGDFDTPANPAATIEPTDLVSERLKWTTEWPKGFANYGYLLHTRLPVNESFNRTAVGYDVDSIVDFGVTEETIEFDTLRQSTIDGDADPTWRFRERVYGAGGGMNAGLHSRALSMIEAETKGHKFAALEIGDKVGFGAAFAESQLGPSQLPLGAVVVIATEIKDHSVVITMIDWNAAIPS